MTPAVAIEGRVVQAPAAGAVDQAASRRDETGAWAGHAAELAALHDWRAEDAADTAASAEQELAAVLRRHCQKRHHEQPLRRPARASGRRDGQRPA